MSPFWLTHSDGPCALRRSPRAWSVTTGTACASSTTTSSAWACPPRSRTSRREHVEGFITSLLAIHTTSTAATRYRAVQQFFRRRRGRDPRVPDAAHEAAGDLRGVPG